MVLVIHILKDNDLTCQVLVYLIKSQITLSKPEVSCKNPNN